MEHGLKDVKFYVPTGITPQAICYNPPLFCDRPQGAFVRWVYFLPLNSSTYDGMNHQMAGISLRVFDSRKPIL